jgi:hypothetical protein
VAALTNQPLLVDDPEHQLQLLRDPRSSAML